MECYKLGQVAGGVRHHCLYIFGGRHQNSFESRCMGQNSPRCKTYDGETYARYAIQVACFEDVKTNLRSELADRRQNMAYIGEGIMLIVDLVMRSVVKVAHGEG